MAEGTAHREVSDQDLLALHVKGDPDAFGELVRRHRDRLWAVALRTLGDREEAADAVQDALVSAYRAAHTFRGQSAVTTWLHRITVNACLDRARKAASRKTSPSTTPSAWSSCWSLTRRHPRRRSATICIASCWRPSARCRPTSARHSSWWTCRDTPSRRLPGSSMCRPGRSRADVRAAEPDSCLSSRIYDRRAPAAARTPARGGTGRRGHPSHRQRVLMTRRKPRIRVMAGRVIQQQ